MGVARETLAAPIPGDDVKNEPAKDLPKKSEPKKDAAKADEPKKMRQPLPDPNNFPFPVLPEGQPAGNVQGNAAGDERNVPPHVAALAARPDGGPRAAGAAQFSPFGVHQASGRLGVAVEKPSDVLVEQLDLPKGQGLVIGSVTADSAAAKAGLKSNDILLELNGKSVPSDAQEFRKQIGEIKAKTPVDAVVLRKGRKETIKGMSLPEAKNEPELGEQLPGFGQGVPLPNLQMVPGMPLAQQLPLPQFQMLLPKDGSLLHIANGMFNVQTHDGTTQITVSGKLDDGKVTVTNVTIQDGSDRVNVDTLAALPEKYREQVQKIIKGLEHKK